MGRKSRDEPGEAVGNRLADAREQVGMSRQELAEAVDVHYQTIGYLERGEYSPSLVLALRIGAVLACRVEELFWLERPITAPVTPHTSAS